MGLDQRDDLQVALTVICMIPARKGIGEEVVAGRSGSAANSRRRNTWASRVSLDQERPRRRRRDTGAFAARREQTYADSNGGSRRNPV